MSLKVSAKGDDVNQANLKELIVNSSHPFWKCDLRPTPRHYGLVKITVDTAPGQTKTLYTMEHGYPYVPSFVVAWSYPAGITPSTPSTNQTYGIGDIEAFPSGGGTVTFKVTIDNKELKITVEQLGGSAQTDLYAEFRFYIFTDDFPLYNYSPVSLRVAT